MDYREELLNKIMFGLCELGIKDIDAAKNIVASSIGEYEITERCTELSVIDNTDDIKILKLFFTAKKIEGGSLKTAKSRLYIYKKFLNDINKHLNEINTYDIMLWLLDIQKYVCLNTADTYRNSIASLFSWLKDTGYIEKNPMENIKPIKHPDPIKKPFSPIEVDALKCACKTKLQRAIVELLLSSGLRCEELCNLKWKDIDFVTKDIQVIEGKGNKNRVTMMDDVTRKYLLEYKDSLKYESEYVFATKYKGKINVRDESSVWLLLNTVGKRAGVDKANPHKFRHTFATILFKRGLDINIIQKLLGHENINTTLIYINNDMEFIRNEYGRHCA